MASNGFFTALQRWQEEKQKDSFLKEQMLALSQETDLNGDPYVPQEALAKYIAEKDTNKVAGFMALPVARWMQDSQARSQSWRQQQTGYGSGGARGGATGASTEVDPYVDPVTGQPVEGMGIIRRTGKVVDTRQKNGKDALTALGNEVKTLTGVSLADITQAPQQGLTADGKFFEATTVGDMRKPGRTIRIPRDKYEELVGKYEKAMGTGAPSPRPGAFTEPALPQAEPIGAAPAAAPQDGTSAVMAAARDAISKGAPREAVIKRLRDAGIDAAGL